MDLPISGGAKQSFNKPAGADDWVIYVSARPS